MIRKECDRPGGIDGNHGVAQQMSDEHRLRLALVGCGAVARLHAERLARDGRAELVALVDTDRERAEQFREQYAPAATIFPDLEAALAPALDGVVLCSPTQVHHEQAKMALARGLHVLCEKPLAPARNQIVELIEISQRVEKILSVAYQRRYDALYVTAKRELQERAERYGEAREVHLFVCERWAQTIIGTWRDDPQVGAGYFGDAGSHQADVCFYVTKKRPEAVCAISDKRGRQVEIVTSVLARLSGGVGLAAHFVGDAGHWREDIHFHCERADLLLRDGRLWRCSGNHVEQITDVEPGSDPDRAFVDAIISGVPTFSPATCALPVYDWVNAVLRSASANAWVDVEK